MLGPTRSCFFAARSTSPTNSSPSIPPRATHGSSPVSTTSCSLNSAWARPRSSGSRARPATAPGYVVAWINRHGSTGFGQKFAQSILNEWADKPFQDIMKGTDWLLARFPNLDPKRLAATGASYGGFMAAWVLGHTDRFACIVDHAGVNNSYSQFATDVPHGFAKVLGGAPWDNVEGMQRNNPMFYARQFKTPTLITHGELDYRVPYNNGLELHAALQALNVPSRLVVFPNENHWVRSPQNSIYWYYEYHRWLARDLGLPAPVKPSFETQPD